MLHLILLTTVGFAAVIEFPAVMAGEGGTSGWLLGLGFCTTAVVGVMSMVTLFSRQPAHYLFRKIFCGMGAGIILFIIFSQLILGDWSRWTGHDGLQCLLMLVMLVTGVTGLLVERAWHPKTS